MNLFIEFKLCFYFSNFFSRLTTILKNCPALTVILLMGSLRSNVYCDLLVLARARVVSRVEVEH